MDNTELKNILKEAIEPTLKEQFIIGMTKGFDTAIETIYKEIAPMTSAKQIKEHIKNRRLDAKKRHET